MLKKKIKLLGTSKGFTLVELIVVIAIVGILAAILIPQFTGFQAKAKSTQVMVEAKQIATAADGLYVELDAIPTEEQIVEVAGEDDIDPDNISGLSADGGHIGFTYVKTIAVGTTDYDFTAVRDASTGEIDITYEAAAAE